MDTVYNKLIQQTLLSVCILLTTATSIQADTEIYYIHNDHRGAPVAMTNQDQTVVWKASYTPFGETTVDEDPDGNGNNVELNVRLPGQYFDKEMGTYYNYYRDYDPRLGRYIQSDPIGIMKDLSNPQLQIVMQQKSNLRGGAHLHDPLLNHNYGYGAQNPVNFTDPFGLYPGEVRDNWDGYNTGDYSAGLGPTKDHTPSKCQVICFVATITCFISGPLDPACSVPAGVVCQKLFCDDDDKDKTCPKE